ncbi:MAG: D-2-hydroxyacid dehydrogenase [Chloroflexi bacterium]|nr:D-2-hydroxyacid dehydrogenase [Chloroflexota bacterium]
MHVVITMPFPASILEKIESSFAGVTVEQVALKDKQWPDDRLTMAEVIYGLTGFPAEAQSPALRWIQMHSAGVDHLRDTAVWSRNIQLTSASGIHASNIAQYVLTQMLTWANRVPTWVRLQTAAQWPQNRWETFLPQELYGKTLGILGYGSIGREVARLAKAFNMQLLVTKRDARHIKDNGYFLPGLGDPEGNLPHRIYPSEATRSMVAECDFVVITLPLTAQTHHLFDEAMFKAMPAYSYLINVGRGGIINESCLVKALKKGWIAGAGLDVFESEPLPQNSPLWKMENVTLTPHISGFTPAYDERATDLFVENLRRYQSDEPLLNLVNRDSGY